MSAHEVVDLSADEAHRARRRVWLRTGIPLGGVAVVILAILAISYYADHDLGFIQDAARAFTTFDRFHCSLMGSTLPNREYMHAGESYGQRDNSLPPQTSTPSSVRHSF